MPAHRTFAGALRRGAAALLVGLLLAGAAVPARAADLLVFAAASLKNALDDANAAYAAQGGGKVTASYAASGALAKQLENAAPADIFISADTKWMDYVEKKGLVRAGTRGNLLGNKLVLVAPAGSSAQVELKPGVDLAALLGKDGRLAIGDPKSVPAGSYAETALQKLGAWAGVEKRLAKAESVRAALAFVSRGEAPLGIVYETDTRADKGVRIVAIFPEDSHPPIIYPIALLAGSTNPEAAKYLAWLRSPAAAPFFEKQGFTILK
ncbi:MAG: molybdate ABC transporter substrate-binding protein [Dongiaceae bacterium]